MSKLEVWLDKLPEDKAKQYNRTRMSIELFSRKLGLSVQTMIDDFKRNGYVYDEEGKNNQTRPTERFKTATIPKAIFITHA